MTQNESFAIVLISEFNSKQSFKIIRLASRNCLIIDCRRFGSLGALIQVIRNYLTKEIFKDISLLGVTLYKSNTVYSSQCNDTGKRSGPGCSKAG